MEKPNRKILDEKKNVRGRVVNMFVSKKDKNLSSQNKTGLMMQSLEEIADRKNFVKELKKDFLESSKKSEEAVAIKDVYIKESFEKVEKNIDKLASFSPCSLPELEDINKDSEILKEKFKVLFDESTNFIIALLDLELFLNKIKIHGKVSSEKESDTILNYNQQINKMRTNINRLALDWILLVKKSRSIQFENFKNLLHVRGSKLFKFALSLPMMGYVNSDNIALGQKINLDKKGGIELDMYSAVRDDLKRMREGKDLQHDSLLKNIMAGMVSGFILEKIDEHSGKNTEWF